MAMSDRESAKEFWKSQGLRTLTINSFCGYDIKTIDDIKKRTPAALLRMSNFGKKGLVEVKAMMLRHGLVFDYEEGVWRDARATDSIFEVELRKVRRALHQALAMIDAMLERDAAQ